MSSVFLMSEQRGRWAGRTLVLTVAEVLLSSFHSAMVLSGSTIAVLVIGPVVAGAVALIVIVALALVHGSARAGHGDRVLGAHAAE